MAATALGATTIPAAARARPSRSSRAAAAAAPVPAASSAIVPKQTFALASGNVARLRASQRVQRRWAKTSASSIVCSSAAAAESEVSGGLSEGEAVATTIKAILGAGIFSLPWAVAQGGIVFVPCFILAACLLSLYTLQFLVTAKRAIQARDPSLTAQLASYTGIVEAALGPTGGRLAEVMNLSCCFGICSAYLVFVGATLATVFPQLGGQNAMVWAITPPMVLLAWLRSMSGAAMIAFVGNISVGIGIAFVCWYALQRPLVMGSIALANPSGFASYFGSVAFLFFIHFTLPAIEACMAEPKRFMAATAKAFGICATAGAAFGVLGAAAFGPNVSSVVITMLGETTIATVVKLLLCVNLMLTFPIVCRSAFLIIEGLFERGGTALSGLQQKALRSAFVVAATVLATSVPSFGALLSLVGGVSLSIITLVFPAAIALYAKDPKSGEQLVPMGALERAFAALVGIVGLAIVAFTLIVR